ncbi:hypothetical protein [Chryseobacterium sp. ISL-6]|uniref:hypothetical protein n=1 Tax=Chryseobacterium sp. ISL-6 TaxID=2819143 RepID=UPI001BEA6569|nr:hypothetical protein [Chryseobacterium sp. ISL-6]MBT2621873.1 hypothetical protein [Chryseobacterium sp. ISL-6]
MKNKNFYLLTLVFALSLVLFACRKEIGAFVDVNPNVSASKLEAAKIWNAKFVAEHYRENSKVAGFVTLKPQWEKSWTVDDPDGGQYLAVPTPMDHVDKLEVSISRLFLFKMDDNTVQDARIVEFVGLNYNVQKNIDQLIQDQKRKSISGFNGAIINYDLNYRWTDGKIYEQGKVTHDKALITRKESLAFSGSRIKLPLYLSTIEGNINNNGRINNYKYLYTPSNTTASVSSGSGSSSGVASGMGGTLSGVTIVGGGTGGGGLLVIPPGGNPSVPINGPGLILPQSFSDAEGIIEFNGTRDPDFPSNCKSFDYKNANAAGTYQVCAVTDLRFDWNAEWQLGSYFYHAYVMGRFTNKIYFEFPKVRLNGQSYTACEAAKLTAQAKDEAEDILESQIESSPPSLEETGILLIKARFLNILKSKIQAYGGRVMQSNQWPTATISTKSYSKTTGECDCDDW